MKTYKKILIIIGLGILFSYMVNAKDHHPTENSLTDANRIINEKFFYGGLPLSKIKIHVLDLTAKDFMGENDQLDDGSWVILIDSVTNPTEKQAEMTMIHEDCHIWDKLENLDEGIDGHGDNFQACMIHVAEHGGFKDLW